MDWLYVSVLALIQGITEFLPVSSSGHLVIAQHLLGWTTDNVLFDATLHLGTALAILVVYWKDIRDLVSGIFSGAGERRAKAFRYAALIVIGTVPAGLVGVLFKDFFEEMFANPRAVGMLFFVTAAFLLASGFRKPAAARPLDAPKALAVGLAQALAILPGVSRSGSTISTSLLLGVDRREAGRFSFLLGLPIIVGAALLQLKDVSSAAIAPGLLIAGFLLSFAVGVAALKILLRFIERGRIMYFGFYLIALGIACLIFI
jgi:undecaprenyl-diphosphatase